MFYDRAEISGPARITKDGYFVADALVARANNIQEYYARELGLTDRQPNDVVRVFRPEDEVFHKDALSSLAHRPITLDHPADPVQSTNWKALAVGDVGDEVVRDGDFVRVPIKIMDAAAIDSVRTNRREFSLGYVAQMVAEKGVHDGQEYDFVAKGFRYNHLAAVRAARGGSDLRIIDERPNLPPPSENPMKIRIGDAEVDATNGEAVRIANDAREGAFKELQTKVGTLTADLATANTTIQTKDGEIVALTAKLADAEVTPAKLQQLADARADVIAKAKILAPTLATDGKTDAEIRKAAVTAKLGDAAKDMADAAIEGAFIAFTKDAKPADPLRDVLKDGVTVKDAAAASQSARASWLANKQTAYRGQAA